MQFSGFTFCYSKKFDEIPIQGKIDILRRTSEYKNVVIREKNIFGFKRLTNEDRKMMAENPTDYNFKNLVIYTEFQPLTQGLISEDMLGKTIEQSEIHCIPEGEKRYPLVWSKALWEQMIGDNWLDNLKKVKGLVL